jgi:hypothetical protein
LLYFGSHGMCRSFRIAIVHNDARTFGGKVQGNCTPNTPACASHQRHLTFQQPRSQ